MSLGFAVATPYRIGGGAAAPIRGRLRVDGRFFVDDQGTARPLFASFLSRWMEPSRDAVLDEIAALGFNGIRIFAGDLGWAGQTAASARAALPGLLTAAAERALHVYVCACTGGGYDVEAHLREVARICATFTNTLLEGFNEVGHPTQSDIGKDPARALAVCRRVIPAGLTWTVGAPEGTDEPTPQETYPTAGGLFDDAHLGRGRDFYNQLRHARELAKISEVTGAPVMSGEPIGADETTEAGRREANPTFFYILGLLLRGFEICSVFHSQDGLNGALLRPNQHRCALEHVDGFHAIPTDDRLQFVNAGWQGSPVSAANFHKDDPEEEKRNPGTVVRTYSFIAGPKGWTALVGLTGDPRIVWGGGWRPVGVIAERTGMQLIEIER